MKNEKREQSSVSSVFFKTHKGSTIFHIIVL